MFSSVIFVRLLRDFIPIINDRVPFHDHLLEANFDGKVNSPPASKSLDFVYRRRQNHMFWQSSNYMSFTVSDYNSNTCQWWFLEK